MDVLTILKYRLGISTNKRDDYLTAIIDGIKSELKEIHGIDVPTNVPAHLAVFIIDYAEFRYNSRGETGDMPMHLKFRLRNLYSKPRKEV